MGSLISLYFRLYQFDMILLTTRPLSCFAESFTDGIFEHEHLDEFSNILTNSSGALIGGSCTGGLVLFFFVLYILYKVYKTDNRINDNSVCARCGRIRSEGGINAAAVLEVCTCMLS